MPDDGPLVFNFGQPGAGPLLQWITLQRLRAGGIRPDRLLVEVMPAMLAECRTMADDLRVDRLSAAELAALKAHHPNPSEMTRHWFEGRLAPIHTWRFALKSRSALRLLPIADRLDYLWNGLDQYGWMALRPDFFNPDARPKALKLALAQGDVLSKFTITPFADQALRRLLDMCAGEHLAVQLLLMPEGEQYRRLYPPAVLDAIDTYVSDLCRDYGVAAIDARTWVAEDGFFDSHHLLPAGARAFSQRLGREARGFLLSFISSMPSGPNSNGQGH
jgi:hypothetical protein